MVVYAIRTGRSRAVDRWLCQTVERSKDNSIVRNPFRMRFRKFEKGRSLILVFDVKPLYPNVTVFGWAVALMIFFLFGPVFWVWPGVGIGMLGFFWSSQFFYLMTRAGLKRAGYKGSFERLKLSGLVSEVVF